MSTTVTPETTDETAVDPRQQRITALAAKRLAMLRRTDEKKPPSQRVGELKLQDQAWAWAKKEARTEAVNAFVKEKSKAAAITVAAEASSVVHRNRKQLTPWLMAAPYAAIGTVAHLASLNPTTAPIGISAVVAGTTIGASWLAWRKKLTTRIPGRFVARAQAGMGLGCAWATAMPVVPGAGQAGMWATLLAGTAYLGLGWWREHAHPIPLADDVADLGIVEPADSTDAAITGPDFAEDIIADWITYVADKGILPGTSLRNPQRIDNGWTFLLELVRGKQTIDEARAAKKKIAAALDLDAGRFSFDYDTRPGANQTTILFTIITEEISNAYHGPVIVRQGGDIYVEIGPYEDGLGCERFLVLSGQLTDEEIAAGKRPVGSMHGGFALGTKGSGKSRLLEAIAVGLRKLGIVVFYLDPQEGKSSPALMAEADWPLSGKHGPGGTFSNITDLLNALKALCEIRQAEGGGEQGFQHTRERPGVMVIIDECHDVFQSENPETEQSFGVAFANLDRIMRKNGAAILGASQTITQDTFGSGNAPAALKDGMCATNCFGMSYGSGNAGSLPGHDGQPLKTLPTNRGYGYNVKGERPHTRFQARYTDDYQPWLAKYIKGTLEDLIQRRIGDAYLRRGELFAQDQAKKAAWLEALRAADNLATFPAYDVWVNSDKKAKEEDEKQARMYKFRSPRQRAADAAHTTGTDTERPKPSQAEQGVLELLGIESHGPKSLAAELGITPQGAGKHLRSLAEKGYAVLMEDGRYMAKP